MYHIDFSIWSHAILNFARSSYALFVQVPTESRLTPPNSYNYTPNNVGDISQITSMKFTVDANNDARVFIGADATPQVVISMG